MQFFFQQEFIDTVGGLLKKKSYKNCEAALIEGVFKVSKDDLFASCSANRLNASGKNPIVKLRVASEMGKSSSCRLYFFVIIKEEKLFFGHIYPKTGAKGKQSLSDQEETSIIKSLLTAVKTNALFEVFLDVYKQKICYASTKEEIWK